MAISFISGYVPARGTTFKRVSNVDYSLSEAGNIKLIDLGTYSYWQIKAVFSGLTESEADTLTDWLETNNTAEIALTIGTNIYTGYIKPSAIPQTSWGGSTNLWSVSFDFVGVKS